MTNDELIRSNLRVVLYAGEQVIAEVEDPVLWQRILAVMTKQSEGEDLGLIGTNEDSTFPEIESQDIDMNQPDLVNSFAKELGLHTADLEGACDPTQQSPFIRLDKRSWAAWRSRTPEKGRKAVSPEAIVATLLTLWLAKLGKSIVTFKQIRDVLNDVGITSKNMGRSINNCKWLQTRPNGNVRLHPSHIELAINAAKSFVSTDPHQEQGEQ